VVSLFRTATRRGIFGRITFRIWRRSFEKELERLAKRLTGRKCAFEDAICNERARWVKVLRTETFSFPSTGKLH
jgi:hypothetical protein